MKAKQKKNSAWILAGIVILFVGAASYFYIQSQYDVDIPNTLNPTGGVVYSAADIKNLETYFINRVKSEKSLSTFTYRLDLSELHIRPDSIVADLGCGTGGFELRLLDEGIPFGGVYAIDIDKLSVDFLSFILSQVEFAGKERIVPVLSAFDDISLPPESVDILISFNAKIGMRALENPLSDERLKTRARFFTSMKKALRPGAKVHIYEPLEDRGRPYPMEYMIEPYNTYGFRLSEPPEKIRIKSIFNPDYAHLVFTLGD